MIILGCMAEILGVLQLNVHANSRRNLGELFDGAYDECVEQGKEAAGME